MTVTRGRDFALEQTTVLQPSWVNWPNPWYGVLSSSDKLEHLMLSLRLLIVRHDIVVILLARGSISRQRGV